VTASGAKVSAMELLTVATTLPVIVFDVGDSAVLALAREAIGQESSRAALITNLRGAVLNVI